VQLSFNNLSKKYPSTLALDDIQFDAQPDTNVLVLIGPSGGGKSTLLRLIGGLESPTTGEILHRSEPLKNDDQSRLVFRRQNGFLFQNFNLFPHLSAIDNIVLPLTEVHQQDKQQARETASRILDRFGLATHAEKMPEQMSGGQQQRVGLARAMAHKPRLLLLDEPTSALDPEMKAEVLDIIEELCREGQQIVLTTHEMGFAKRTADEIIFLSNGKILGSGVGKDFFNSPPHREIDTFLAKVMKW